MISHCVCVPDGKSSVFVKEVVDSLQQDREVLELALVIYFKNILSPYSCISGTTSLRAHFIRKIGKIEFKVFFKRVSARSDVIFV